MRHDMLLGILIGAVIGLAFQATLAPHLPFIVILAVLLMTKVINVK